MEVTSVNDGGDLICMYKRNVEKQDQQQLQTTIPLCTVTLKNPVEESHWHDRLELAFQALYRQVHPMDFTHSSVATLRDAPGSSPETTNHLAFLQGFIQSALIKAFSSTTANHYQCFVNCAQVTIGGFGGTWHHDATSQLTHKDGTIMDYLALCYLHETDSSTVDDSKNSYPWLECALSRRILLICHTFCPVATYYTMDGPSVPLVLVLRNDFMMHRTPVLCHAMPGKSAARRFFYIPFRALDHDNHPVFLDPPVTARWTPYNSSMTISEIQGQRVCPIRQTIMSELMRHGITMTLEAYILHGKSLLTLPWSKEELSYRPNWLFDDPDDY